jgi:hypothetical protein
MNFFQLFQFCSHITHDHIPSQIAHVLGVARFLAMTKPSNGIHPITVGEALYRLTNCTLCFQFREYFPTNFSPYQIGVATKGDYEIVIHGVKCTLNLHLD